MEQIESKDQKSDSGVIIFLPTTIFFFFSFVIRAVCCIFSYALFSKLYHHYTAAEYILIQLVEVINFILIHTQLHTYIAGIIGKVMMVEATEKTVNKATPKPNKIKFFTDRNTALASLTSIPPNTYHSSSSNNCSTSNNNNPVAGKKQLLIEESSFHQCEQCGKVYKHRNCLSKHRWEHHESWELTRKICATKHQQVQMLEAAQVLLEMKIYQQEQNGIEEHSLKRFKAS